MINKRSARLALLACASVASLGLIAGATPAAAKTKFRTVTSSFTQCQNVSLPLGDNTSTSPAPVRLLSFTVPNTPKTAKPTGGAVTAVSAAVRITHTFDADVAIYLVSPTGRVIPLDTGHGGSGDNFGSGSTDCNGTLTTFSDPATTAFSAGTAPFAGSFKPDVPLSGLNGGTASGVWTLVISDTTGGDNGTIHAASLNVTYQYKVPKRSKKK